MRALEHRKIRIAALAALLLLAGIGVCSLAEEETIILGQENAATETQSDWKTAGKLLKKAYDAGQTTSLIYYGNWYGPGLSGGEYFSGKAGNSQPIDELDAIAQRHDFAYDIAAEMGKKYGPHEEARLKALADAIAVREANALPRNPLEWDPPAPDPEKAADYRNRIGFGFVYTSKAAGAASKALGAYQAIRDSIANKEVVLPASSEIDEHELQRLSQERAREWYKGSDVRPIFRIELSSSTDLIEEGGSADVGIRWVPILNEGTQAPGVSRDGIDPDLLKRVKDGTGVEVSGYGEMTAAYADGIRVSTTKRMLGLRSTVGTTITVKASYEGPDADVVEDSVSFVVALRTQLAVQATPSDVQFGFSSQEDDPCRTIQIQARLTTSEGGGIEGMPLTFARDDGSTATTVTDSEGYASVGEKVCPEDLDGEIMNEVPFIVTTASLSVGDQYYTTSSETVNVLLRGHETALVRGRVVDKGRNDRPIEGAAVKITDPFGQTYEGTTGGDGSFSIHMSAQESGLPEFSGTVTANGYESGSFTATTSGKTYTVGLYPQEATLIGHIVAKDKDGNTTGIDGSTVRITSPFDQLLTTNGGDFTVTGLYVGDTVTMRADAQNFRAYVKSGKITMENPVVTFVLTPGSGQESNVLEEKEADESERQKNANLSTLYSLMVWATPADPSTFQNVTITAQIFPPKAGVSIEIQMHGTDDYASSITGSTDAMGRVLLSIPGASSGVVDDIVAWIVGTTVKHRLRYSF
jgi:hypothetical protein